jgi:non-haem dioxygenase in morphine synthesis N-terminal
MTAVGSKITECSRSDTNLLGESSKVPSFRPRNPSSWLSCIACFITDSNLPLHLQLPPRVCTLVDNKSFLVSFRKFYCTMPSATPDIPVIDFANWNDKSTPEQRDDIAQQLAQACRRVGFVYIINHGVAPELLKEAFGWTKRLFDLKEEQKMLAPHPDGSAVHRGYSWPGLEKVSQVMSENGDPTIAKKLRKVTDCKVRLISCVLHSGKTDNDKRKAMKLVARRTLVSPTSGYRTTLCLGFVLS